MEKRYVADLLVDTLSEAGVERVYGITGDSANHIIDAISRSKIRFIHTRHEEVAAFAAGAESAVTGRLAVCMGSCGPGSLHLVNGLYDAHRNGSSLLAIVTEIDQSQIGADYVQEIDTQAIFRGCSYFCQYVRNAAQLSHIMGIAMQTAISRKGVSVIIISGSISSLEIEKRLKPTYLPNYTYQHTVPSVEELASLAHIINNSTKVAIFGGYGCKGAFEELKMLSERIKAPVVWTSRSIDILDSMTPYPAGMTGILGNSAGAYALEKCEILLVLGCGFAFTAMYPDDARIVQIDIRGENLSRRHNIELGLVGDIAPTIRELLPLVEIKDDSTFAQKVTDKYCRAKEHLAKLTLQREDSTQLIYPERLTSKLNDKIAADAWISSDIGTPWAFATRYLESKGGRHFYTSSLHGTMASAMPSAIGLSLAAPSKQVVALCGDGGISMLLGDILTLRQELLHPKIFVYNNSNLDFVAMEMKADGLVNSYTNLAKTNFAAIANAMGIKGIRVESVAELDKAIDEALSYDGAVVVDVVVDPLSMLIPPQITSKMIEKYSHYATKMFLSGNTEELLAEFIVNKRSI